MSDSPRAVELSDEELEVLLRWAEQATRGVYPSSDRYLSEVEARLLARLEALRREAPDPVAE